MCSSLQLWDKPKENPSNTIFEVKKTRSVPQLKQGLTRSCTAPCLYVEIWCTYMGFFLICEKNGLHRGKIYGDHGSLNRPPHALVTEIDEVPVQLVFIQGQEEIPPGLLQKLVQAFQYSGGVPCPSVMCSCFTNERGSPVSWTSTLPITKADLESVIPLPAPAVPHTAKHISIRHQTADHRLR